MQKMTGVHSGMKNIALIFLLVMVVLTNKAQTVKVFSENRGRAIVLYVENSNLFPVSLTLSLNLSNMIFSSAKSVFIIPPKMERFRLGELTVDRSDFSYQWNYNYKWAMGDVTLKKYDTAFIYDLPFGKGKSFHVFQGYNGASSHVNENALDFTMPEGSEILAAREGRVVQVIQNNDQSCPYEECKKYNNHLLIMHPDGTFACYAHIKYNGSNVKLGDNVKKGDVIAYSGNTGWSTGPHFHFACFLGAFDKWRTIETRFRVGSGDQVELLKEGSEYGREY